MAVHFHPLTVSNVSKETPDCVIITFDVPEELRELFNYTQGQNITLKKIINGEEIRRSYSICTAPFENKLSVAVKKVTAGRFSNYANSQLQKEDVLEVLPPTGLFGTQLKKENKKNYLAIAAGSGITPVISILKAALTTEAESSFTLVYANRSRSSIIFFEELAGLKNKYPARFNFINILSGQKTETTLNFGRIGSEKLKELKKLVDYKSMDEIFICGPGQMLLSVKEFLKTDGIEDKKIHFELFNVTNEFISTDRLVSAGDSLVKSHITIRLDGRSVDFDLTDNSESILDAGLKAGADLPFACKGGVCCTCRAMLVEGEVKMDQNYALEEEELAKGYILTCQSHPLTQKIMIDFDSR